MNDSANEETTLCHVPEHAYVGGMKPWQNVVRDHYPDREVWTSTDPETGYWCCAFPVIYRTYHPPKGDPDVALWVASTLAAMLGAPFLQALATKAGEAAYQYVRDTFRREAGMEFDSPEYTLKLLTTDGRVQVKVPGDISEEALQDFIDQMSELLADDPDADAIYVYWYPQTGWVRNVASLSALDTTDLSPPTEGY